MKKEVYEKLLENLANMTPKEKEKEWKELKEYNEIGPEVKEILKQNNMERKVGEIFTLDNKQFQVVEGDCDDCYFRHTYCSMLKCYVLGNCKFRKNEIYVCFKLIK